MSNMRFTVECWVYRLSAVQTQRIEFTEIRLLRKLPHAKLYLVAVNSQGFVVANERLLYSGKTLTWVRRGLWLYSIITGNDY